MTQLHRLLGGDFRLPYASESETRRPLTTPASNLPTLFWPNGRFCTAANLYLLELFDRGLSTRSRGGTITTYASNISHLVRFCFARHTDFHELTDGQFSLFIGQLRGEKDCDGQRVRSDNQLISIARSCLEFLEFVAADRADPVMLGRDGRIRAYRRRSARTGREAIRWMHAALPMPDAKRRRNPISSATVERLRNEVMTASSSVYLRRRRYAMIRCLEMTGGRRIEVASLRVSDVTEALASGRNELRMLTAKRRGGKAAYRLLPCVLTDLAELQDFIRTARRQIVRKTIGLESDHGYLFVNERTGAPLLANTITQEIQLLARRAGVNERVSPHLFRHRFITKVFVALIHEYDLRSGADFRRALLALKDIQFKLQEWTGHLSANSLEHYIDLAFAEVEKIKVTFDVHQLQMEVEALRAALRRVTDLGNSETHRALRSLPRSVRMGNGKV